MKVRSALITGSTSGIGLGIAKKLASIGYNIVLNGLGDKQEIDSICQSIKKEYSIKCIYIDKDLTQAEEVESLVKIASSQLGSIEILINNAGVQYIAPIENFPVNKWDQIISLNLSAAFHTIRMVIPQMKTAKFGRIINIASAHGLVGSPLKSAYVAAKHGVVGLTKSVALEVANEGITCNAICPGYVLTPLVQKQIPELAQEKNMSEQEVIEHVLLKSQARKEFIAIEEIAELCAFLCSDLAKSITGIALPIDAGWTAS